MSSAIRSTTAGAHHRVLMPVLRPVALSGEMVVVPDTTAEYAAGDLASLPAAAQGLSESLGREK